MQSENFTYLQGQLPAEYRPSRFYKILFLICFAIALGGLVGVYFCVRTDESCRHSALPFILTPTLLFAAWYLWRTTFHARIVLYPDRLEDIGALKTNTILREDIAQWRTVKDALLLMRKNGRRRMSLSNHFDKDELFFQWLDGIPNPDLEETQNSIEELFNDDTFGNTPDERADAHAEALKRIKYLNIASLLIGLWGFIYPSPYALVVALLLFFPVIALLLLQTSHGRVRFETGKNSVYPSIGNTLFLPAMALALRGFLDFNLLPAAYAFIWPVIIALLLVAFVLFADPAARKPKVYFGALLVFLLYGYGAAIQINSTRTTDHHTYPTVVQSMRISHGKSDTYYVTIAPTDFDKEPDEIQVSSTLYRQLAPGQPVELMVRTGLLGIRWKYIQL